MDRDEWIRVFYRVYRLATTPPTPALMVEAARLSMNVGELIACYSTAAQLHGLAVLEDSAVHVMASERRSSRPGLVVHRDRVRSEDIRRIGNTRATSPTRTAVDMARTLNRLDALATLDSAIRRGVARDAMQNEVVRHAGKRGVGQASELVA
ncbi:MAG: hypothetical protein ICV72_01390, partial [Aldersonia sp.]|nr:hypothetical protein [Aldersonia sp.]